MSEPDERYLGSGREIRLQGWTSDTQPCCSSSKLIRALKQRTYARSNIVNVLAVELGHEMCSQLVISGESVAILAKEQFRPKTPVEQLSLPAHEVCVCVLVSVFLSTTVPVVLVFHRLSKVGLPTPGS